MRIRTTLAATALAAVAVLAGAGTASAGSATANGIATNSPGVFSGNQIQIPINFETNICGNTMNVFGLLNPTVGNVCING
ncbi:MULTISPECIES: chaplin [Kitasatospora]|uniref:Chaplin n=1 Tax=Kitasatospora cathayae TaxID=3004092 RepID=A0ABY7QBE4_9ACTN|nr:chaplin [Kitasatospora sp. HUAS 3-15]WBP90005.1 chaplin [Kitasatospora sp. HUAS 3-15]